MMRVVIADDHYLLREGLRALLDDGGEVEVCAAVGGADELIEAFDRLAPDAVITDIRMPHGMEGIEAAHRIRARHPHVGVLVLSQHADGSYADALLARGTEGLAYLLKERVGDVAAGWRTRASRRPCRCPSRRSRNTSVRSSPSSARTTSPVPTAGSRPCWPTCGPPPRRVTGCSSASSARSPSPPTPASR